MKNRLFWLFIISLVILIWFFIFLFKLEDNKNNLEKNKWITENNTNLLKLKTIKKEEINSWYIEEFSTLPLNYAYFYVNYEKFFFDIVWKRLELKLWENSLWFFDIVLKDDLNISEIFWENKYFLIEIWENKYIYSKQKWFIKKFETKLKITYSKYSNGNFIFFSDEKWSFILYKDKNDLEYFPLFKDFIFYKDWYIWIIDYLDFERKSRFSLPWSKNIIFYFEPDTNKQKIIYELDFYPKKIYEFENKIFFENKNDDKFFLENY